MIRTLWKNHGTKVIGYATTVAGTIGALDPDTMTALLTAIAGERGPSLAMAVIGAITAYRGHLNTKGKKP